jgi:cell wall-associated NlpC family hydrolase
MDSNKDNVVEAAYSFIGAPFRHHFQPDLCASGWRTEDECMESGMDTRGFDCSGLIIASFCKSLDIKPQGWNRDFRHLNQLAILRDPEINLPTPGDLIVFAGLGHVAIYTSNDRMIHASRYSQSVEESTWDKSKSLPGAIPVRSVLAIAR